MTHILVELRRQVLLPIDKFFDEKSEAAIPTEAQITLKCFIMTNIV